MKISYRFFSTVAAGTSLAEALKRCGAGDRGWVRMASGSLGYEELFDELILSAFEEVLEEGQALVVGFAENPDGSFRATIQAAEGPDLPDYLHLTSARVDPPPSK